MVEMTPRERTLAAVAGQPVDRPPVGFWGHDFLREWSAEGLAAAMVESVRTYGYDFLKVNPRATYYAEAWGCRYRAATDGLSSPEPIAWVLSQAIDLEKVRAVDGTAGPFAEQLDALRMIRGELGDLPLVQTVFSPLSVLGRLANDRKAVRSWMDEAPDALHSALEAVTATLAEYTRASLDAGADGIFFATTEWATYAALTLEQYNAFGRPYDLRVLEAAAGAPMNVLHVCRPSNMLTELLDYPVDVVNWAQHAAGNATLADVLPKSSKAVMGGVDERTTLLRGSPEDVKRQVRRAIDETGGQRFLLAPGCSIEPATPPENIRAAMEAVAGG
jgi:uroporphyrinogen decarboxylase